MSGFDLGPVTGFDQFYKRAAELGGRPVEGPQGDPASPMAPLAPDGTEEAGSSSFEDTLSGSLDALRSLSKDVDTKYKGLVLGEDVELHDVMLAANKSEVMFNLMLEVRNKLVDAWEKLARSGG